MCLFRWSFSKNPNKHLPQFSSLPFKSVNIWPEFSKTLCKIFAEFDMNANGFKKLFMSMDYRGLLQLTCAGCADTASHVTGVRVFFVLKIVSTKSSLSFHLVFDPLFLPSSVISWQTPKQTPLFPIDCFTYVYNRFQGCDVFSVQQTTAHSENTRHLLD